MSTKQINPINIYMQPIRNKVISIIQGPAEIPDDLAKQL